MITISNNTVERQAPSPLGTRHRASFKTLALSVAILQAFTVASAGERPASSAKGTDPHTTGQETVLASTVPGAPGSSDSGTPCSPAGTTYCRVHAVGGTDSAGDGQPPSLAPLLHTFNDPQTLTAANGVGAIDFLTQGGNGIDTNSSAHGANGGQGGIAGDIAATNNTPAVVIGTAVTLNGANPSNGIVNLVSQGGRGGNGSGADRGTMGTGGNGGAGGGVVITMGGTLTSTDAATYGVQAISQGGAGGSGAGGSGPFYEPAYAGDGGRSGIVDVSVSGTITSAGTGVQATSQGGNGGAGPGSNNTTSSIARPGASGGASTQALMTVDISGTVTSSGSAAVYVQAQGGVGGTGGTGAGASIAQGGDGGAGGAGGMVDGVLTGTVRGHTIGMSVSAAGGGAGDAGGGAGSSSGTGGAGGAGGNAGQARVDASSAANAFGDTVAVTASANGGVAGKGGDAAGDSVTGGRGGRGGNGGSATIDFNGTASNATQGAAAIGLSSIANGGDGGAGSGSGGVFSKAGNGGDGGTAGVALTVLRPGSTVTTTGADQSTTSTTVLPGLLAQANGGVGGAGGRADGGVGAVGGGSGHGGSGGMASVSVWGDVSTTGSFAYGALAQSAGGIGSSAGGSESLFVTHGGVGQNGGAGGTAIALGMGGSVTTIGTGAAGVVAQSTGGGGGVGGNAIDLGGGIVGIGGNGGAGGDGGAVKVGIIPGDINTNTFSTSIVTRGGQATGLLAQSIGGGGGNGGNATQAGLSPLTLTIGGDSQGGGNGGAVTVNNEAQIVTIGEKSGGIAAQSVAGGGGNGGSGVGVDATGVLALNVAIGGKGGNGGNGGTVSLANSQQITTYGSDAYGIKGQSIAGGGGEGGTSTAIAAAFSGSDPDVPSVSVAVAVGGSGGVGGTAGAVNVANNGYVATAGHGAYGVFAESVAGGGGNGGDSSAASYSRGSGPKIAISVGAQGNGGAGGTGGAVTVTNAALITTLGESAHGVLAQSVGGGGGTGGAGDVSADTSDSGSFGFSGSLTVGGQGGTGSQGGLVTVTNQAGIATQGDSARGIFAQSVGGGGGTAGGGVAKANGKDLSLSVSVGGNGGQGGNGGEVNVMNQSSILTEGADADAIYAQSVGGGGGSAGKGSSTAGGTNSGAEVAANMVVMLSNGLNLGKTVVQKGDKVFQIGDGVLKDVTAINDLRKAIGGTPPPTGVAAAPGADPAPDPAPDPNKDGDATNIAADLTIGGQGGAAGNSAPVKVDNTGSVETDGSRSNGIFAQSVGGGGGVGGLTSFSMAVNDKGAGVSVGGSGTGGGNGGEVDVTHEAGATILTQGAAAHGIYAQSVGGGGGKGGLTGSQQGALRNLNLVLGGSGGVGGIGGTVTVDDSGAVKTTGEQAFGIFAQSAGGGGGTADVLTDGKAGSPDKVVAIQLNIGGSGGSGGDGGTVNLNMIQGTGSNAGSAVETDGNGSLGVVAQSIGGGGGTFLTSSILAGHSQGLGGVTIPVAIGGSGGSSGNGGVVNVTMGVGSSGAPPNVLTNGKDSIVLLAQSIGGGGGLVVGTATPSADLQTLFASTQQKGNGGAVNVSLDNQAWLGSNGDGAVGILAQSIGGGGGVIGGMSKIDLAAAVQNTPVAEGGQGGNVTVSLNDIANIVTHGTRAHGIVAQSLGGGGGVIAQADGNGYAFSGSTPYSGCSGDGCTGAVTVNLSTGALVRVTGPQSYGIVAQSRGNGVNDATVNINPNGWVESWQDAAGAIFMSGAGTNTINNHGTIDDGTHTDSTNGKSKAGIAITGNRPIIVNNYDGSVISGTQILDGSGGTPATAGTLADAAVPAASVGKGALNNMAGGTIEAGSELRLGGGTFNNYGTLIPAKPSSGAAPGASAAVDTVIDGNYVQSSTGRIVIEADHTAGVASHVTVTGTAELDGTLEVNPTRLSNTSLEVLSAAGGVTLDKGLKTSQSAVFSYETQSLGNTLRIQPHADFTAGGTVTGQTLQAVAAHLQEIWNSGGDLGTGFAALASLKDIPTYQHDLKTLSGQTVGAISAARFASSQAFVGNLYSCPTFDDNSLHMSERDCAWARFTNNDARQDSTADASGYRSEAQTLQLGAQKEIAKDWFFGVSGAYEISSFDGGEGTSSISGNAVLLGAVLKYQTGPWLFSTAIDGGYGWYDSDRRIDIGKTVSIASGKPTSEHAGIHERVSYQIPFEHFYLKPILDLHATYLHANSYTEHGAAPFNLAVDSESGVTVSGAAMMEIGGKIELPKATLRPFASFGVGVMGDSGWAATAHFAEAGVPTAGFRASTPLPDTVGKVSVGADLYKSDNLEFKLQYNGDYGDGYISQSGVVRVTYRF